MHERNSSQILPPETIAKRFVDYMDSDDAVDIIREMDEDKQEEVLRTLKTSNRQATSSTC